MWRGWFRRLAGQQLVWRELSQQQPERRALYLGLLDRLQAYFTGTTRPTPAEVNGALWGACHGGQQQAAQFLLDHGAALDWIPDWENLTPLDAATRNSAPNVIAWLRERGAKTAAELGR